MKIKPLNKKKEKVVGQWIEGHFYPDKKKSRGRLPQLSKQLRARGFMPHDIP